jgi:hypothetical protein
MRAGEYRTSASTGSMLMISVAPSVCPRSVAAPMEIQKYGFS